jgi:hypothetical protein
MEKDAEARRIVVELMAAGLFTLPEAARWAGVSRHLVRYWCTRAGVDWKRVREQRLTAWWRKRARNGPKLVEVESKAARTIGTPRGH